MLINGRAQTAEHMTLTELTELTEPLPHVEHRTGKF
jgi:hypothetical protein